MIQSDGEIIAICEQYNIRNYKINPDGSIDVNGSVYMGNYYLHALPVRFNRVYGGFYCNNNYLTTLDGLPNYIKGKFWCQNNPFEHTKENFLILSRYNLDINFYKNTDINIYNMIIAIERLATITEVLK